MKNFEELTEEEQNEVILKISSKLEKQEIWYWEGLVHKLREYEQFVDSDMEIRAKLLTRIDTLSYSLEQANKETREWKNDLLYVLEQLDGYLDKGWTIDLNFTDIREKYKEDIKEYENWK